MAHGVQQTKKKRPNVKQLIERMSEGQQRRTLARIENQGALSEFLGKDFDDKMYDQVVYHLKASLGEF